MKLVNKVCRYLPTANLKASADLMFAAAQLVTDNLAVPHQDKSSCTVSPSSMPPWKQRLQSKLAYMREDLSRLVSNQLKNSNVIKSLYYKYLDNGTSLAMAIEILHQKVAAIGRKLSRYIPLELRVTIKTVCLFLISVGFINN